MPGAGGQYRGRGYSRGLAGVSACFCQSALLAGGSASPIALRRNAAHEAEAGLEDWAGALARGLVRRGTASMILPAARFGQAAAALRGAGCGSLTMLPLWPRAGVAAKRVILQAIKGGRGPDRLLPGLVLHEADGSFTAAAEAVLRHAQALPQG